MGRSRDHAADRGRVGLAGRGVLAEAGGERAHPVAECEDGVDREARTRGVDRRLDVVAERLGFGEGQNAALALEGVDAAANVGGGLADESLGLGGDGEVLELGDRAVAAGDPGVEQFDVGRLAAGGVELVAGGFAGGDRLDQLTERRVDVADLAHDDLLGELGGLARAVGDLGGTLGRGIGCESAEEFAEADKPLQIRCVGEDCGLRGRFDRCLESHRGTPSVGGLRTTAKAELPGWEAPLASAAVLAE